MIQKPSGGIFPLEAKALAATVCLPLPDSFTDIKRRIEHLAINTIYRTAPVTKMLSVQLICNLSQKNVKTGEATCKAIGNSLQLFL